jgi:lysozyme family protein
MAIFDKDIINIEGGLTNDRNDGGGLTKYGISQRSYPHLDIPNLTTQQALNIYEHDYWDRNQLSLITSQLIANQLFLLVVNTGAEPAIKIMQSALVRRGMKVTVDGVIGSVTISAINMCNPFSLSESMRVAECKHYLDITDNDATQKKFFRGWIRRALL